MGFRLVPKSVTLNDHEQRKTLILRYFTEFGSFEGQLMLKWLKTDPHCLRQKCSSKYLILAIYHLRGYSRGL